jgi:hypothetical protein
MVITVDLLRYWLHRACHRFHWLWRLHKVHHAPDILYALNVGRFHPVEKALHFCCDTLPFLLLGVAPEVIAGYFLLYSVNGFFQHSNVKLRYGWLNYLVGSAQTLAFPFRAIEEPLRPGDYEGMRRVASALDTRIILDESLVRGSRSLP